MTISEVLETPGSIGRLPVRLRMARSRIARWPSGDAVEIAHGAQRHPGAAATRPGVLLDRWPRREGDHGNLGQPAGRHRKACVDGTLGSRASGGAPPAPSGSYTATVLGTPPGQTAQLGRRSATTARLYARRPWTDDGRAAAQGDSALQLHAGAAASPTATHLSLHSPRAAKNSRAALTYPPRPNMIALIWRSERLGGGSSSVSWPWSSGA